MSEWILETKGLTKDYDGGRIRALRGVDLTVREGEFVAVRGPSGSGKSTLLHLLGGLDQPTRGEVRYRGQPLTHPFDVDRYRSQCVGFVFQAFYLLPTLTALENVQIPMMESRVDPAERRRRAETLLAEMGLDGRMHQRPSQLSAGERQRVAIARSLANHPEILLADEPTGNLDSENSSKILELLAAIQGRRNMTMIVVTHEKEVARRAQRCITFRDGRICESSAPQRF